MQYKEILRSCGDLQFQKIEDDSCNYSYFPVVFPDEQSLIHVMEHLQSHQVFPRRYFYPSVNTFSKIVPYVPMSKSEDIASRVLCLPLYKELKTEDVMRISQLVLNVVG